jgi:hypothetical protein
MGKSWYPSGIDALREMEIGLRCLSDILTSI